MESLDPGVMERNKSRVGVGPRSKLGVRFFNK